jgi:hypothetical protein
MKESFHFVSMWEWRFFLKEYFLQLRSFKVDIGDVCSTYDYSAEFKKDMYLSKENHLCYKLQHVVHCFSVRNE